MKPGETSSDALTKREAWSVVFGVVVLAVAFIGWLAASSPSPPASTAAPPDAAEYGPPAPTCREQWTVCTDNADLLNHYGKIFHIQNACRDNANDLAKFGTPEWPNAHWLLPPFGTSYKGDEAVKTGRLQLLEDDV